jgi:hypothetical protein
MRTLVGLYGVFSRAAVSCLRGAAALFFFALLGFSSSFGQEVPTAWQVLDDGIWPGPSVPGGYDTVRQRAIGLGFRGSPDPVAPRGFPLQVWELVGEDWVRRFPSGPQPDTDGCTAFDEDRGVLVVFGGPQNVFPYGYKDETWEYDGTR